MMESTSYFAEERKVYEARREAARAELKAAEEGIALIDRLMARGKPPEPRADLKQLVRLCVETAKGPMTGQAIAKAIGRKPGETGKAIDALARKGEIDGTAQFGWSINRRQEAAAE